MTVYFTDGSTMTCRDIFVKNGWLELDDMIAVPLDVVDMIGGEDE